MIAVGARFVTGTVRVVVTALPSSSVTRMRTVLVPAVSKTRDASMSVPSSNAPSLSVSHLTSTIEPSGSVEVDVNVTRCSDSGSVRAEHEGSGRRLARDRERLGGGVRAAVAVGDLQAHGLRARACRTPSGGRAECVVVLVVAVEVPLEDLDAVLGVARERGEVDGLVLLRRRRRELEVRDVGGRFAITTSLDLIGAVAVVVGDLQRDRVGAARREDVGERRADAVVEVVVAVELPAVADDRAVGSVDVESNVTFSSVFGEAGRDREVGRRRVVRRRR